MRLAHVATCCRMCERVTRARFTALTNGHRCRIGCAADRARGHRVRSAADVATEQGLRGIDLRARVGRPSARSPDPVRARSAIRLLGAHRRAFVVGNLPERCRAGPSAPHSVRVARSAVPVHSRTSALGHLFARHAGGLSRAVRPNQLDARPRPSARRARRNTEWDRHAASQLRTLLLIPDRAVGSVVEPAAASPRPARHPESHWEFEHDGERSEGSTMRRRDPRRVLVAGERYWVCHAGLPTHHDLRRVPLDNGCQPDVWVGPLPSFRLGRTCSARPRSPTVRQRRTLRRSRRS